MRGRPSWTATSAGLRRHTVGGGGALSTRYLEEVTAQIGAALREGRLARGGLSQHHGAGDLRETVDTAVGEAVRQTGGVDFGVCVNPEFCARAPASATSWTRRKPLWAAPTRPVARRFWRSTTVFGTELRRAHQGRRDDEVRGQQFPCGQDRIRQRSVGSICAALGLDSYAVMDIFLPTPS